MIDVVPISHTTVIYPLYGLRYESDRELWISESPFDTRLTPIRLDRWLKQPVLQIGSERYNMGAVLTEVANTQGAHSDHQRDAIRQRISKHLQGVYLNIFALVVGAYLQSQFANSLVLGSSLKDRIAKVFPNITEDAGYRLEVELSLGKDQLPVGLGWADLWSMFVTQDHPIVSGVPVREDLSETIEPIVSRVEIKVPKS
ncbi:hypothetical protein F4X86_04965 [Candidatus Saccharibacteria bacterium]|nr:hypothetical protein [Candidatus Saccharibacteria bacterium]